MSDARLEALQERCERQAERITQLEALLGFSLPAPLELGLTGAEARVLGVLRKRDVATKDTIMAALYRSDAKDEAEIKIVDVFVCKIRKKVKPFGIQIETVWGQGYRLAADSKALIASMTQAVAA